MPAEVVKPKDARGPTTNGIRHLDAFAKMSAVRPTGSIIPYEDDKVRFDAPPTFVLGPRSGESVRTWAEELLKARLSRPIAEDVILEGVEQEAFADFRPPPSITVRAQVTRIRPAEPDLALSAADWESFDVDGED
jgi:hypothetical protein